MGGNISGSWHKLTPHYVIFVYRPAHTAYEPFEDGILGYYSSTDPYLI